MNAAGKADTDVIFVGAGIVGMTAAWHLRHLRLLVLEAGPHPNRAHAAWRRRARRLEPDPETAPVVVWMFAQRLAGHSLARITRALNDVGITCPSRPILGVTLTGPGRRGRWARCGRSWPTPATPAGRCGTGSQPAMT